MADLIFPSNPTTGQEFIGTFGEIYTWDGQKWTLTTPAGGPINLSGTKVPIAFFFSGKPPAGAVIVVPASMPISIPNTLVGSVGVANTAAATAAATFALQNNGVTIGTANILAGGSTFTFSGAGASIAVGNVLRMVAPTPQDSTMSDVAFSILAVRQ